jgi:hypothetical protein
VGRGGTEHDEEKENYRVMERRYGRFQQSMRLPDTVDEDKIEASFDNGILKARIPKRPEAANSARYQSQRDSGKPQAARHRAQRCNSTRAQHPSSA